MKITTDYAIIYLTECTMSTVIGEYYRPPAERSMTKAELGRQVSIAQTGIDFIKALGIKPDSQSYDFDADLQCKAVLESGLTVRKWLRFRYDQVQNGPIPFSHKPLF